MKRSSSYRRYAGALLACFVACATAQAEDSADAGVQPAPYNFAWKISGTAAVAPIQVFDSGTRVLMLFKDQDHIPIMMADVPGGQILLQWHRELPYIVINHLESRLEFRLGTAVAYARRADAFQAPQGVETGSAAPIAITGSALPPVSHEQLISDRRTADADVSDHSVLPDAPSAPAPVPASAGALGGTDGFELRLEDRTIANALQRWAQASGWTFHWISPIEAPISAASHVPGNFATASATVMLALEQAGYPLSAIADSDHKTYLIHDAPAAATASKK